MSETIKNETPEKTLIETENFVCVNCGATMAFDIKKQTFMCPACKTDYNIKTETEAVTEHDFDGYAQRESKTIPFPGVAVASCPNCGAEITFGKYQISSICPMCSSTHIAAAKQKAVVPPDGIIPFKIDKQDAQQRFRVWAKSRWFAPNDFKKRYGEGGLEGMYLPFWAYSAHVTSNYTGLGGRYRVVRDEDGKTRTEIDWYPTAGTVTNDFADVQVCASNREKHIAGILPYRMQSQTVPYSTAYLSGYYAEMYNIKADTAFQTAKQSMEQTMRSLAENQIRMMYDQAQVNSINSQYTNVKYKYALLPLWSSVFGYKGKKYGYLINGETGAVSGERPYSIPKIAAAVIACAIIISIIIWATSGDEDSYSGTHSLVNQQVFVCVTEDSVTYNYIEIGEVN